MLVVEVPAIVNQKGIQPIHVGTLPPRSCLMEILPTFCAWSASCWPSRPATLHRSVERAGQTTLTHSYEQALGVLDEMLAMESIAGCPSTTTGPRTGDPDGGVARQSAGARKPPDHETHGKRTKGAKGHCCGPRFAPLFWG